MKATLGLFLGVLLSLSLTACDDGGSGGSGGTGGSGGSGGAGGTGAAGGGGSGGAGGQGGAGAAGGGGSGGGSAAGCAAYCTDVLANCKEANAQFADDATCKSVCAFYAAGMDGAMDGDSLACRTYHGGAPATGMPDTNCTHSCTLRGCVCGASDCDNFCTLADAVCGDEATPPYADKAACMTACAAFPGTAMVPYNPEAVAGDSLACRTYHLTVATTSASNKTTHCPHIAAVSTTCK